MRILHVIANLLPEKGGPPLAATRLCRHLARLGHDVGLFTGDGGRPDTIPAAVDGVDIRVFPTVWDRWQWSPSLGHALRADIAGWDLVHIHSVFLYHTLAASRAARRADVPYIIRPHGSFDPWLRRRGRVKKWAYHQAFERAALASAAGIHYTTDDEKDLTHRWLGVKNEAFVVPLGIDPDEFDDLPPPDVFKRQHGIASDHRIVLFLGRVHPKKAPHLLVEAFAQLLPDHPRLQLVLAGPEDPAYGREIRARIDALGLGAHVTWTGMLDRQGARAAYGAADVFALPSRTENFGIAVVEAMGAGVPMVISPFVNIAPDVKRAQAGLVADCDPAAVAAALDQVLINPEASAAMARRARQLVEREFTWTASAARMADIYQRILSS